MAAWSLVLQAELDEIVKMAKVLAVSRSDSLEGRGHWLLWVAAWGSIFTKYAGDEVFEGEKGLFHPGVRPLLGGSMEIK